MTANIEPATLDIKVKSLESDDPQESVKRTQMYASEILFCFLKKTTTVIYMCFTPDARGIEFLFCPQNFKMITSAKHLKGTILLVFIKFKLLLLHDK